MLFFQGTEILVHKLHNFMAESDKNQNQLQRSNFLK